MTTQRFFRLAWGQSEGLPLTAGEAEAYELGYKQAQHDQPGDGTQNTPVPVNESIRAATVELDRLSSLADSVYLDFWDDAEPGLLADLRTAANRLADRLAPPPF